MGLPNDFGCEGIRGNVSNKTKAYWQSSAERKAFHHCASVLRQSWIKTACQLATSRQKPPSEPLHSLLLCHSIYHKTFTLGTNQSVAILFALLKSKTQRGKPRDCEPAVDPSDALGGAAMSKRLAASLDRVE